MAEKIVMPQLGESIAEGTIVKWLKSPGESVKKDENILLISTDKVEAEIPSPIDGVLLETSVGPGETVPVGTVLGMVGKAGEATAAAKAPAPKPAEPAPAKAAEAVAPTPAAPVAPVAPPAAMPAAAPSAPAPSAVSQSGAGRFLSPLVRKIAADQNVSSAELDALAGSGREGRVTKNDLLAYVKNRIPGQVAAPSPVAASKPAPVMGTVVEIPAGEREIAKPVSTMRRVIMENMVASRKTSAHVTTFFEIDYTNIDKVRMAHKDRFKQEEGVALTYTTFLAAAVCQTLKRHSYLNAQIKGDQIVFKKDVHLGMAVAISDPEPGLMVPVIRNADQMNLRGLARAITDLAGRVRTRKIKPDELSGGSFTITNPGNYGAIIGTPIINQPQVAILGVGQIKKQPVVLDVDGTDVIAIRNMGWLALSFDHRLIDGATADIFMADLKSVLENWTSAP